MTKAEVRVERDPVLDADWAGWRVVVEIAETLAIVYRGDIAECEDMAEDISSGMNRPTA